MGLELQDANLHFTEGCFDKKNTERGKQKSKERMHNCNKNQNNKLGKTFCCQTYSI